MIQNEDIVRVLVEMDAGIDASKLKADVPLISQGLDSLDMATLMFELETKYQTSLAPENAAKLRTIEQIVNYLNR